MQEKLPKGALLPVVLSITYNGRFESTLPNKKASSAEPRRLDYSTRVLRLPPLVYQVNEGN